ncbi:MAG: DUF4868 domain-containing protein [Ktedonobacteraceae bacterium]|nr:DUF4868 domain-containing protein [Ktedonobacteraceae bacterium]
MAATRKPQLQAATKLKQQSMTTQELERVTQVLTQLLDLTLAQCDLDVCLASTQGKVDPPAYRRVNITEGTAQVFRESIQEKVLDDLKEKLEEGKLEVQEFSVEPVDEDHIVSYIDLSKQEYDVIKQQLAAISQNYNGLDSFDQDESKIVEGLRFYANLVQPPNSDPVYFYRKYAESQVLKESSRFGITWQHNNYEHIKAPTLLFDRSIDCLSYQNHLFIFKKENFYTIFRYMEAIKEAASKTLESLETMDIIHNFPRFRDDCMSHSSKQRILKNIAVSGYLENLTIDQLEQYIKKYGRNIQIRQVSGGKRKLHYDHSKPYDILNVLNDNYYESDLTSNRYQASSKQAIGK